MKLFCQASRAGDLSPQFFGQPRPRWPKSIEAVSEAIIALRHGFDKLSAYQTEGTQNGELASNVLRRRNVRAELHGLVWNFPAASAQSDCRNHRRKNDYVLHLQVPH
jgi:hypothetical protein